MAMTLKQIKEKILQTNGIWTGCYWTVDEGKYILDLDGTTHKEAKDILERWNEIVDTIMYSNNKEKNPNLSDNELDTIFEGSLRFSFDWEALDYKERLFIQEISLEIANEWEAAMDWLESVENNAGTAEELANKAVEKLEDGDLEGAYDLAEEASDIEYEYGDDPIWGWLRFAIEEYMEENKDNDGDG